MRKVPVRRSMLAAGAALALALTPAAAPAAPASPAPDKDATAASPVEALRQALDRPVTIKIDKQPLATAIEALKKATKINIVLDELTIQQQLGFQPEQSPVPVEVDLKDVPARTALRTVLAPYGLGYAPIGDAVVVTTDDMAMSRQLRQRVSLDLDSVEFAAALRQISRATAVNLIVDSRADKQAGTKVSLHLEDVPLETAVRLLAEMANLKPVRIGNVLFVTTKEIANDLRNDPDIAQPNANIRAQELQLQQLQLQLQAQNGLVAVPGASVAGPGTGAPVAAPPGVTPAVPPAAPPADVQKDDKSPSQDAAPKDQPPADPKPLTK